MPRGVPPARNGDRAGRRPGPTAPRRPTPRRRRRETPSPVAWWTSATPWRPSVARRGLGVGHRADDHGADRDPAAGRGQRARQRQRLQRELDDLAGAGVDLAHHQDHRSTPSFWRRSTTAGAASGPSPITSLEVGGCSRQVPPHPAAAGGRRRLARPDVDLDLLRGHPALERRVARLGAALEHGHHGRQRHLVGLVAVRPLTPVATRVPSRTSAVPAPVTIGRPDGVRQPDRHLEVAGVGGVVAEQHQVVRARRRPSAAVTTARDLGGDVGRAERDRVGLDQHPGVRAERERAADLLDRLGDADADDRSRSPRVASATWIASSTAQASWSPIV